MRTYELNRLHDADVAFANAQSATATLKKAVDDMVEQQDRTAQTISMQAEQQIRSAKIILTVLSIVAVISAVMVAWLYVARGVVRRLGLLSEAMRRIAGGNLDVHIQDNRGDEIAEMANSIEVFRENAIALDQLLAEREEAAARLEKIVEQRTAELQRRGAEMRVTFDNMVHGVLMFDSEMKLAAWNRQVLELLKLPRLFSRQNRIFPISFATLRSGANTARSMSKRKCSRFTAKAVSASHVRTHPSRRHRP